MRSDSHLSLSLGHGLWEELLRQALPVRIVDGEFDALRAARGAVRRLELRERVVGLIEDRRPPERLVALGRRVRGAWRDRREGVVKRVDELVRVNGTWRVELDDAGTALRYGEQKVGADAFLRGTAEGTIHLLRENVEIPFRVSRRIGASVTLDDIHFAADRDAVVGSLRDIGVDIGEARLLQLASRLVERVVEPQLAGVGPIQILSRDQVEGLVGPLGGPLRMHMGVERMELLVTEHALTLEVRFGFTQRQLSERDEDDWG